MPNPVDPGLRCFSARNAARRPPARSSKPSNIQPPPCRRHVSSMVALTAGIGTIPVSYNNCWMRAGTAGKDPEQADGGPEQHRHDCRRDNGEPVFRSHLSATLACRGPSRLAVDGIQDSEEWRWRFANPGPPNNFMYEATPLSSLSTSPTRRMSGATSKSSWASGAPTVFFR